MALTKSDSAKELLRRCLNEIWGEKTLLSEDEYFDNAAQDAVCCMEAMLQLGVQSADFRQKYDLLSQHPVTINRQAAIHKLSKYFS